MNKTSLVKDEYDIKQHDLILQYVEQFFEWKLESENKYDWKDLLLVLPYFTNLTIELN